MSIELIQTISGLRSRLALDRQRAAVIGLVPTMGALHAGHARLMEQARRESDCLVASIFVNPIQFNRSDDYERYPRTLETDLRFCGERGVDVVFAPSVVEMYPEPLRTHVDVARVSEHLCGKFRPGHFRGVATVVAKLLSIVQPDRAYFGEKDAQQLAVIRRMARDLNLPVEIVPVATVRESDGLALSSRNQHLSEEERRAAPVLYRALLAAQRLVEAGATDPRQVRQAALAILAAEPLVRPEYLELVDTEEMQPVARIDGPVRVVVAAWLGPTRLIDNVLAEAAPAEPRSV
jgi:pantoate--beta-alanine ligase